MMINIGAMIGERYEIIEKIGTGGMADVYRAKDHRLNRFVAVKILKNELTKYEGITPRKARIIYYRILFANNIMSARNGALITDSIVKKIIDLSMSHNNATDIKSAYSDLIEMVVPY